ncbi:MAG: hypothetical protein IT410_02890 [Candidatus Doudnabacteria bacterium]|nr:hypothetical protein [Candidatus Doudnabacteria bacterium]
MKSLLSMLSVAIVFAFVSPLVADLEAKASSTNKSPPSITITGQRIHYGSDDVNTMPMADQTPLETITTSASMDKVFAPPAINSSKMTGSTDGKSVNDPAATLAGTDPYIVLYINVAIQRTMIPAMAGCNEAILRAPRKSARSGPEIQRAWRPFAGLDLNSSKP